MRHPNNTCADAALAALPYDAQRATNGAFDFAAARAGRAGRDIESEDIAAARVRYPDADEAVLALLCADWDAQVAALEATEVTP